MAAAPVAHSDSVASSVPTGDPQRRWPAEWEPQDGIWLAYPHRQRTWPRHLALARDAFANFANTASQFTQVHVLARSAALATAARKQLAAAIQIHPIANNDTWIRDYGPTFVHATKPVHMTKPGHGTKTAPAKTAKHGTQVIGIDWQFNAWGGKYPPWGDDDAAAAKICQQLGIKCERSRLTLEGGAIEGDGQGRLLTTPICLENPNRNPGWSRERIAKELHRRLGVTEIVWVDGGGLEGDDTDGHIDQLARFVTPTDVVVAVSSDPSDPNAAGLRCNLLQITAWAEQTSPRVTVHLLPTPPPRKIGRVRVPESYCNFLMLGERAILVPTFGHRKTDQAAMKLLKQLRPAAEVVGVDASTFILGRGAWHCASQQQPSAPRVSAQ